MPEADANTSSTLTSVNLQPMHAVVRAYHDGSGVIAVYGIYFNAGQAQNAITALQELGVPDHLQVVPFYQVNQ